MQVLHLDQGFHILLNASSPDFAVNGYLMQLVFYRIVTCNDTTSCERSCILKCCMMAELTGSCMAVGWVGWPDEQWGPSSEPGAPAQHDVRQPWQPQHAWPGLDESAPDGCEWPWHGHATPTLRAPPPQHAVQYAAWHAGKHARQHAVWHAAQCARQHAAKYARQHARRQVHFFGIHIGSSPLDGHQVN